MDLSALAQEAQDPSWIPYASGIALLFLLAWIVSRLSQRIAGRLVRLERFSIRRKPLRSERRATLQSLLASLIGFLAIIFACFGSLALFIPAETLLWVIGLFSAGIGFSARPIFSDLFTGIGFIFEDSLDVGEKVELPVTTGGSIEGIVEAINLRTTQLRAPTGELYTIPNGEVRVIRNFSRGRFSVTHVTIQTPSENLNRVLPILEELGREAVILLPNLLEPWKLLSETGVIGQQTELTLIAKTRFGKAAEMRPRLLGLIQERLAREGITLAE
jgi:small conductance mechanosensitive channel